jgi:hypothetical protein
VTVLEVDARVGRELNLTSLLRIDRRRQEVLVHELDVLAILFLGRRWPESTESRQWNGDH